MYQFHPAILSVNHQINEEAGHILRDNLFVKLTTDVLAHIYLEGNGLRGVAEDDLASRVTYCASELTLVAGTKIDEEDLSTLVFPADELDMFCSVLLRSCLARHICTPAVQLSIMITITGIALNATSHLRLLEPFYRLYGLSSVRIFGEVSDEYKSILTARMLMSTPDFDAAVQDIHDTMKMGDQAADNKNFSTAIARYKRALDSNFDNWPSHEDLTTPIKMGRLSGNALYNAFSKIEWELEFKLAVTYLKIESHERAHRLISSHLRDIKSHDQEPGARPGGPGVASIYSVAAQASEGLGLVEQAVEEMKEAVEHDPADPEWATELVRLKWKAQNGGGDLLLHS